MPPQGLVGGGSKEVAETEQLFGTQAGAWKCNGSARRLAEPPAQE
jgi:hypothetical protein